VGMEYIFPRSVRTGGEGYVAGTARILVTFASIPGAIMPRHCAICRLGAGTLGRPVGEIRRPAGRRIRG
jgi:hypothetical protein